MRIYTAFFLVLFSFSAVATSIEQEILKISDGILTGDDLDFIPVEATADHLIPLFYETRGYAPAWQDRELVIRVLDLLQRSHEHGLHPEDYHVPALNKQLEIWDEQVFMRDRTRAIFDVMLTDGLLLYVRHMMEGKVDPEPMEYAWNYSRLVVPPDQIIQNLSAALEQGTLPEKMQEFQLHSRFYSQLSAALVRYRTLEATVPYELIADEQVLRPGQSDPLVEKIRARLVALEFLAADQLMGEQYDETLTAAVIEFQDMHGLDMDGIVGRGSYAALNTSWSERIDQIRINMDRLRWVGRDRSDNFVVVNIAGFELYLAKDGELIWNTNVMVGKVATQTPMFRAQIKYLVFNPTWTVPRSIIKRSLYGKFAANPAYIAEANYKLYDRDGVEVTAEELDWSQLSRGYFPYRVVQQPGLNNALGRVKFMFPNRHAIYLHDTSHRELFDRNSRAFSAGCIRVEDPLEFARILLDDEDKWGMEGIQQTLDSGELQNVYLKQPLDVLLMYWTASASNRDRIRFHPDIYQRDAGVLKRLDGPPVWAAM